MVDLSRRLPAHALMQKVLQDESDRLLDYPAGSSDQQSWFRGTLGEIVIAGELAALPDGWTVLHSVPVGDGASDIDHVVIGPPGVFVINTKTHPGKTIWAKGHGLKVGAAGTRYVPVAWAEADRAADALATASGVTAPVAAVLVFVATADLRVSNPLERDVRALAQGELVPWLLSRRRELNDLQVARLASAAKRPGTWSAGEIPRHDYRDLATRFHARVARDLIAADTEVTRLRRQLADAAPHAHAHARAGSDAGRPPFIPSRAPQRRSQSGGSQSRSGGSRSGGSRRSRRSRRGRRSSGASRLLAGLIVAGAVWFFATQGWPERVGQAVSGVAISAEPAPDTDAVVERVVDGDTVDVALDGATQRVRILSIDTPETVTPDAPVECLGPEASALATQLLPAGTPVRLAFDVEHNDQYGRVLASVVLGDGRSVGAEIARAGLADPVQFGANSRFLPEIEAASAEARAAQVGLFAPGACPA